jgi:hypothetical protein
MAQKKLGSMLLLMMIIYEPLSFNLLLLLKIIRLSLTFLSLVQRNQFGCLAIEDPSMHLDTFNENMWYDAH